ncbi:hypothetical protein [Streptomyces anulatus]|uniref:hypothetical protein n=1 Tax=Streptomyces anulatus TaxID=1892 RepID=UPI003668FA3A
MAQRSHMEKALSDEQHSNTWNVTVNGGAPQMGTANVQHNTFGYDPQQLAAFTREVLEAAHRGDVPAEVEADAEALQAELATSQPDEGRVRQLTRKVWEGTMKYAPPVLATGAAQAAAGFLGIPIGF